MQCEDKGKVHQLFGLSVQRASGVNLLEVVRVAFAGVEVAAPEFRHFSPHQNGTSNELEGDLATTRPRVQAVSWNRLGIWAIPKHLCGQLSNLWRAVLEEMRPIYGWLLRDRGGLQPDRPRPRR